MSLSSLDIPFLTVYSDLILLISLRLSIMTFLNKINQ